MRVVQTYIFVLLVMSGWYVRAQSLSEQGLTQEHIITTIEIESERKINTKKYDFSPMWYRNGIVFVSQEKKKNAFNQLYYADIVDERLENRVAFELDQDTLLHEGPLTFTMDNQTMFFTRSNYYGGQEIGAENNEIELQIFVADRVGGKWKNIRYLPFNSSEYSNCHPTWDEQNQRLYFSSNRPGGQGGFDLYYVDKQSGKWSDPVNMGSEINSSSADAFPFYHPYGYLIFASKRKIGTGYDLYLANTKKENLKPIRLPEPLNSNMDDLGLILNANATKGYFSSDQSKKSSKNKNDDIFSIKSEEPLLLPQRSGILLDVPVQVISGETKEPLASVHIKWHEVLQRNLQGTNLSQLDISELNLPNEQLISDIDGLVKPTVDKGSQYLIQVDQEGYLPYMQVVTFTKEEQAYTIELNRKETCKHLSIQFLTEENQILDIQRLYVLEMCTGDTLDMNKPYCPKSYCDYKIIGLKEHYLPFETSVKGSRLANGLTYQLTKKIKSIPPIVTIKKNTKLEKGLVYLLSNIYYDYDDAGLNRDAVAELDRLANIMKKNRQIRIELKSHTDCRGSASYNMELSNRRAKSVGKYLVLAGISPDRIISRGYGESQPRNHCIDNVDCSEVEHRFNRRTELQVIE